MNFYRLPSGKIIDETKRDLYPEFNPKIFAEVHRRWVSKVGEMNDMFRGKKLFYLLINEYGDYSIIERSELPSEYRTYPSPAFN